MGYWILPAVFFFLLGCALFGPVTVGRKFVDLPARTEPCAVAFLESPPPTVKATLIGELDIDATDPGPDHWKDEVRRQACAIGADSVWVSPITERRDEWNYCGGRDSLCRDRFLVRYLGTVLAYHSTGTPPEPAPGPLPKPTVPAPEPIE